MKNYIITLLLIFSNYNYSQIAIGKNTIDGSGIIDFNLNTKGGIVLPYVSEIPAGTSAANGTLIVNAIDNNSISIQARQNNNWINLTDPISLPTLDINNNLDIGNGIVIGNSSTTANGVLVLESNTKALILPKVTNIENYKNSPIGTIFYDLASKSLVIFDGNSWIYWR